MKYSVLLSQNCSICHLTIMQYWCKDDHWSPSNNWIIAMWSLKVQLCAFCTRFSPLSLLTLHRKVFLSMLSVLQEAHWLQQQPDLHQCNKYKEHVDLLALQNMRVTSPCQLSDVLYLHCVLRYASSRFLIHQHSCLKSQNLWSQQFYLPLWSILSSHSFAFSNHTILQARLDWVLKMLMLCL